MQISSKTALDEYIDFDAETISEQAVDTTPVDWRFREKSLTEALQSEDTTLINALDNEIADDEQDARKMTTSKALDSLDVVNCFVEIHGDKQMNVMLNELVEKVETLKLQNVRQSTIRIFF